MYIPYGFVYRTNRVRKKTCVILPNVVCNLSSPLICHIEFDAFYTCDYCTYIYNNNIIHIVYIIQPYRYTPPNPKNITKRTGHDNSNCTTIVSAAVGYYKNVYEIPTTVPMYNSNIVTIYTHRYHSVARHSFILKYYYYYYY